MSKDVSFSFDQELYFMSLKIKVFFENLKIKVGIMENLDLLEFSVPVMPSCPRLFLSSKLLFTLTNLYRFLKFFSSNH